MILLSAHSNYTQTHAHAHARTCARAHTTYTTHKQTYTHIFPPMVLHISSIRLHHTQTTCASMNIKRTYDPVTCSKYEDEEKIGSHLLVSEKVSL